MKLKNLLETTVKHLNDFRCTLTKFEYVEVGIEGFESYDFKISINQIETEKLVLLSKTYRLHKSENLETQREKARSMFFKDVLAAAIYAKPLIQLAKLYPINNEA